MARYMHTFKVLLNDSVCKITLDSVVIVDLVLSL